MSTGGDAGGIGLMLPWGNEERTFRLGLDEWRRIQAKCDAGPEEIAARLRPTAAAIDANLSILGASDFGLIGKWRIDDVREVIFQGLLGGGMGSAQASILVRDNFDLKHKREHAALALAIVIESLEGLPTAAEKKPGETKGERIRRRRSPAAKSRGTTSTGAPAAPDTMPDKSEE